MRYFCLVTSAVESLLLIELTNCVCPENTDGTATLIPHLLLHFTATREVNSATAKRIQVQPWKALEMLSIR
eukprot:COSAG01_NODE_611_length_14848_cov_207.046308_17_plen_71_part_00